MFNGKKRRGAPVTKTTSITFSANDLTMLGQLVATGQSVLGLHGPAHPAVVRLKAAMTRVGVPVPRGL